MPAIDENTAISKPGTYYVYAKTGETKNYEEDRSATVALTVTEPAAASVTRADGTDGGTYTTLPAALDAAQDGDTVTLLSDVDLGETYVTIDKSITFDLGDKTLSSSKAWLSYGVLMVKNATVTVKNGTVKATGSGSCAIRAYGSGASMTLEDVTATVTSDKSSVTVGDFGSAVIKSGDYQGLYVGAKSQVTLEGGTFRPYMDTTTNENVKSIFWKVNETTDATSRDCMELLGDGCVYVDENQNQVRTGGGFNTVVTVQQGTAIDAPVAKIGDVEYASLSKAIDAVQNGGTITLLDDLDLGNGAVLQVGFSKKDFTIDLNSHTLSADGACLIMLHNGSQLTLKNGTLDGSRCTSYDGVLYISSNSGPKLTLENVTAKSGTVMDPFLNDQRSVLLAYVTYGTVEFDGGTYTGGVLLKTDGNAVLKSGTFRKGTNDYSIKTEDSGKHLSDYLDESLFWNGDTVLDLSSETQTADEVTVRPCEHNWENGKCTVCQKVCDHGSADGKSMTEDPCPTCGMKAAAQVDITGSDAKYFPSFTDALVYATKNNGCTLKLLADVTGTTVMINNPFIFDLNGHSVDALSVDAKATIKDSGTTKGRIGKVTVSNEKVTDLTLGGLLEEGYAFKYGNGYWANDSYLQTTEGSFVTVEKAPIQSVNVYAKDKNNQEILTIAYGATGEVTLVSSCKLSETSGENLSCAWYKLTDDTAIPPLEGAAGTSYKLPADLPAGTYTYRVTFTSDYYSKSAEITITVTPISLVGAAVTVSNLTYNGNPQEPTVTVKLGDETLSRDNDYTVQVTKQTDAGSYKLTIKGGGNYSGEIKDVEWKIEPMKIDSVMVSSDISKVYDGTAEINMSANEWATALKFKTLSASGVVDVPSKTYTISDAYFVKKSGEETIYSPDAGEKYGITFKIALKSSNYVLQNYYDEEPAATKEITQSGGANFTIKQAAVTSPAEITQYVYNDLAKTYTLNLAALLPELSEGCEYGDIQYQGCDYHFTDSTYLDSNNGMSVSEEGILTLPTVSAHTSDVNTQIGTITVPVVTTNYQNFEFTIKVVISARIPLNASGVTVSSSEITYGQTLNESKLTATGTMKHPGTGEEVKGTFAWKNGTVKPDASDSYEAEWTFTPAAGYEEYAPATGTVTIKVNKATPTFTAPTAQENLTYTGQEQALITAGMTDHGTMRYSLTENGTYSQDIPTGTDAGAYTVWYRVIGDANHNDTAPASVAVRIGKKPLTITGVTVAPKPYDGTTNADISSVTFDNVTLNRGTDYTVTASFDDAGVGSGKNVTATVTLMEQVAKNYVLEQSSFPTTGNITKAAAPDFTKETALTIVNGHEKTYTVTLPTLPTLETPKEYGAPTYELGEIKLNDGYYTDGAKVENGKLTLPIQKNDVKTTGSVGTATVVIKSTNYENITLTVNVSAVNKIKPTPVGEITASEITYGDTLSKSKISGKMKDLDTGKEVEGTFAWPYPYDKPSQTGDYNVTWIFTPAKGYEEYETVTGIVKVPVAPKSIEGATITLEKYEFAYNAKEQSPKITRVTLENWDKTRITYDIKGGGKATDVSDRITLTIEGTGNYTGTATAEWKIIPAKLTVGVSSVKKEYDGTTNATVTPTFNGLQGKDTLTAADYSVTAAFDNANVGYYKTVTGTVTLKQTDTAKNYVLRDAGKFSTDNGTIAKAAAPTVQPVELTIYNGVQKDYFVDLPPLPELGEGKSYGTVGYRKTHTINLSEGYKAQSDLGADPENQNTLRLLLHMTQTGSLTGEIGTVTIPVTTSNYQDINLTVNVSAVNQIKPKQVGTITATPITYGNELSMSTITGTMQDPATGDAVNGTFTWVTPDEKLKAGNHNAEWTFTPYESYGGKYTTNTGTATVTVNPKAVTVSGITANDKVYDGTTNAVLDYSAVTFGGVLENDTLTVTATGTMESAGVGERKVRISDLTLGGASAANYVLAESENQTETTATITAKKVTVTITPNGGTYGSVTAAAANLSGAVDRENVPVTLTYTGNGYNDTAVPVNAGSYTVTVSISNSNYTLTGNTTADFVITPKAVTVSGITANDKVYDGTTNAVLDYSNAQFDGILENDKLTVAAKGVFEKAEAGKQNVAISDLKLGGDSAANYVLAESGNQTETTATITAKEVTVTPDNKSKVYEEKDPKLTYIVSGVLSGETLKGITLARAEGENAGEYDITGTADAGANPNYDVTFAKGTFTIKPKSIQSATVVLGKGLAANGAEQTQTVEKVLLNNKELPADSYTVAGNTATDPGSRTLTITAKGNYTGTVDQTYVIVPAKAEDSPGEEIVIGSGKVKVNVKFEGTVPPATLLTNKAELLAMLVDSGDITADELAQIADGASVDIVLTVKEANVPDAVKTAMAQAAKDYTIGQYLDISLFKYMTVNGSQQAGVALHTTKNALTISVAVPDALINTNSAVNRTYCIVRNHEGTITVLDAAFDAASKTLTFKTDRFSDYAIAYKDTAVPSSGSNPGSNNSSNGSETKKNEVAAPTPAPTPASTSKPSTITAMPQTGDTSNPTLYVVLLVASLLGLAVVFVCKKRNNK